MIAPAEPVWPEHGERHSSGDGSVKLAGRGCIDRNRDYTWRSNGGDELGDGRDLDKVDVGGEDPLELGDSDLASVLKGQRPKTHDDHHDGLFCVAGHQASGGTGLRATVGAVPRAPKSRPERYAELTTGELADAVERAYDQDEVPDWELVFELTRRALSGEGRSPGQHVVGAIRQA